MEPRPPSSRGHRWLLAVLLLSAGCGSMHFSYHSRKATRHIAQARQIGAEELAPYEFQMATLYMDKAHEEAGKAEYQDAVGFARVANEQAIAAVGEARRAQSKRRAEAAASAEVEP